MVYESKMLRRLIFISSLILNIGTTGSAFELDQVFNISSRGIKLGEMDIKIHNGGGAYRVDTRIYPTGLVGRLLEFELRGKTQGAIDGRGNPAPKNYELWTKEGDRESTTRITYRGNRVASMITNYEHETPLVPTDQVNSLDPITAIALLIADQQPEKLCNIAYEMYGGARRIRIVAYAPKPAEDGLMLCNGFYEGVDAATDQEYSDGRNTGFRMYFKQRDDGMMTLVRLRGQTNAGWVTATPKN